MQELENADQMCMQTQIYSIELIYLEELQIEENEQQLAEDVSWRQCKVMTTRNASEAVDGTIVYANDTWRLNIHKNRQVFLIAGCH